MEHKLITGGEQYLPFARSRIKAMRATGLMFASQQYEIDGCSIKVRIEGDHEFITLSGGGHVSAFPDIQYPEVDVVKAKVLGGVVRTGTFPATVIDSSGHYSTATRRTRFGTSPYNTHHLRKSQNVVTIYDTGVPFGISTRAGVVVGGTSYYDIFLDGVHVERVTMESRWGGGNGTIGNWQSNSSEYTPCIVSGSRAVLAVIEVTAAEEAYSEYAISLDPNGDPDYESGVQTSAVGQRTIGGQSSVKLRIVRMTPDGPEYDTVTVAPMDYSRDRGGRLYFAPELWLMRESSIIIITNDVERSTNYRRWHATERISSSPNNSVFVLRETNTTFVEDVFWRSAGLTAAPYHEFLVEFTRGYSLSFVSPDRRAQNHIITGDLGAHGYIDGVFPSSDNKHVYVYYGLHDSGETAGPFTVDNLPGFLLVQFNEYLDEISITKNGSSFTLAKVRTISLGAVTLRAEYTYDGGRVASRSDHYASKLHGATLAVGEHIWADRYCYNLKTGEFAEIPDFVEYPPPFQNPQILRLPDQITSPEDDRTSYLNVSSDGTRAMYTMFKSGTIACYTARNNPDTGVFEIVAGKTGYVGTAYSWGESLQGLAAQYI